MAGRCEHPGLAPDGATWTVFGERMLRDRADDEDLERVGWLHYDWKRRPA